MFGEPNTDLGFYSVSSKKEIIVRKAEALDSEFITKLQKGSRVHVTQIKGRRVRIDQPVTGWCSLISSNGDTLLTKIDVNSYHKIISMLQKVAKI